MRMMIVMRKELSYFCTRKRWFIFAAIAVLADIPVLFVALIVVSLCEYIDDHPISSSDRSERVYFNLTKFGRRQDEGQKWVVIEVYLIHLKRRFDNDGQKFSCLDIRVATMIICC